MVDAAAALREKLTEIKGLGPAAQYGLFLADEDPKKGVWLEPGRTLEHYLLRENVSECYFLFDHMDPPIPFNQISLTMDFG